MATRSVTLKLHKTTKGAVMFREIDPNSGDPLDFKDPKTVLGSAYVRKQVFGTDEIPEEINVIVRYTSKAKAEPTPEPVAATA